ncbi:hypothetical protein Pmani_028537 [Petrolisthes manimaculis]|uniref:Uncharacterized protein n=1 Tax=Petrolisthes manimaculis TaxID=1843537 RepID=A0AAE1NZC6_9EUCA|nr:hypothetical protein Pmani_028537 [Petrolisthes manimaculis]
MCNLTNLTATLQVIEVNGLEGGVTDLRSEHHLEPCHLNLEGVTDELHGLVEASSSRIEVVAAAVPPPSPTLLGHTVPYV